MYVYRAIFNFCSSSKASNTFVVLQHSLPAVDKFLTSFVTSHTHSQLNAGQRRRVGGVAHKKREKQKATETKEKQQQNLHNNNRKGQGKSRLHTFCIDSIRCQVCP